MKRSVTRRQGALIRAVGKHLSTDRDLPYTAVLVSADSNDWSSLTFTGERHVLVFAVPEACSGTALDGIEFVLPDAIVAVARTDMAPAASGTTLTIELLVIDQRG